MAKKKLKLLLQPSHANYNFAVVDDVQMLILSNCISRLQN